MSKDTASTRIPRLDGASRIPLPGNISSLKAKTETSALLNQKQQFANIRTPLLESQYSLMKSSSGDRLNSALNTVSKKTTTTFKKIFSKSTKTTHTTILDEKNHIQKSTPPTQQLPIEILDNNDTITIATTATPNVHKTAELTQLITRSSTFVRTESQQDLSNVAQSTPMSRLPTTATKHYFQTPTAITTESNKKNETFRALPMPTLRRKGPQDQMTYIQNSKNKTQTINATMTFNTQEIKFQQILPKSKNETVTVSHSKSRTNVDEMPTFTVANQKTLELLSPMTNATYSNPGSADNLMNLEDESMPSCLDLDTTLQAAASLMDVQHEELSDSLPVLTPDKTHMKLPLNSTMNTERLIDLTTNELNFTKEFMRSPRHSLPTKNSSKLLYMSLCSATTTPDRPQKLMKMNNCLKNNTTQVPQILSPLFLKGAQSDLVLPIRTPDEEQQQKSKCLETKVRNVDERTEDFYAINSQRKCVNGQATSLQDVNKPVKSKARCSFGLDLTESALDCCSLELIDVSLSSQSNNRSMHQKLNHKMPQSPSLQLLQQQHDFKKQSSFELDESLGILTPDQMKGFLDSTATSHTNNLELPLNGSANNNRMSFHQMRMEQTPSPEELPLDPVEVKTDISDFVTQQQILQQRQHLTQQQTQDSISQNTEGDNSKTDQMVRSNVSKISTSFITSVTSVTSLDTGYQGDGEMSRPASRGASDHSPSNGPIARKTGPVSRQPSFNQMQQMPPPVRRQDLMTDSDFFTESDADDLHHRGGDRRAQVIDGQLYGPTLVQSSASVFITEHPQMEDSCMESSGVFTDVENRCEEDLSIMRRSQQQANPELSPDGEGDDSTETVKSNRIQQSHIDTTLGQGQLGAAMLQKQNLPLPQSCSNDRLSTDTTLSNRTSYCSVEGTNCKSFCSLEETAFNYEYEKTLEKQPKNELTTGTQSQSFFSDQLGKQSYNQTVDNLSSPRKHASLTSLTVTENTQAVYFSTKNAIKSASGTAIYEQISGTRTDKTVTRKSPDIVKTSNKVSPPNKSNKIVANTPCSPRTKSNVPNKWEAVMNKIATNKATQVRKNYNDVKSKVSTRNVLVNTASSGENSSPPSSASPRVRRSPTTHGSNVLKVLQTNSPKLRDTTNNNANVLKTKRLALQTATKRVRSFSKDSQKSSQSDLSLVSGSPKLLAKTPIRAAKKRDVRNLSISPTDLGPPPKTLNGTDTRSKTVGSTVTQQQKRIPTSSAATNASSTVSNTATPTQTANSANTPTTTTTTNGGVGKSMPVKKQTLALRRLESKPLAKSTKDHSRLLGTQTAATPTTTPPTPLNNGGSKVTAVSEMQEMNLNNNNNSKNNNVQITTTITTTTTNIQTTANGDKLQLRTNSQSSSPILSEKNKIATKKLQNNVDKKSQMKLPTTRKLLLTNKHATGSGAGTPTDTSGKLFSTTTTAATTPTSTVECMDGGDLQQLKLLNRHLCNGRLDYESLEHTLAESAANQEYQEKSVTALAVLLNYLVQDLDAFAVPAVKLENTHMKDQVVSLLKKLDEIRDENAELQHQLIDKESYYSQREEELQQMHRCELQRAVENGQEIELLANKRIQELETKLAEKDAHHKHLMDDYRYEMELKLTEKQQQLICLEEKLQTANNNEKQLTAQMLSMEKQYMQELDAAVSRENELTERVNNLKKELDKVSEIKQHRERELRDKLNLSQDEIALLRSSPRSNGEPTMSNPAMRHSSASCRAPTLSELSRLQNEAESLRCVLELKQKEISKLNKQNEELMRDAEERSMLRGKIHSLESHKEMLQSELDIKIEKEKEYLRQIDEMQKKIKYESQKQMRLSLDNEALSWQLKQRSEQLHLIHSKLSDSLKDSSSLGQEWSFIGNKSFNHNSTSISEQGSPPASPSMKGFIEKSDSVSWVLEMDDETPEAAATKLVRRVGSFRSVERSPSIRRHYSVSNNGSMGSPSQTKSSHTPNPLSQSMSATSVIRQHSTDATIAHNSSLSARIRSQSMSSGKYPETVEPKCNSNKKLTRKKSTGSNTKAESTLHMRPRSSTLKTAEQAEELLQFRRASSAEASNQSRKLITCDSSALNSGERLELHTIPKASGKVLKGRKKCLEIQESAGEAMVSGTNSEDEGCSASSDEIASSECTGSGSSNSSTSLHHMKNSNMSLEEVLLLEKINSLNGTPMECSWSDDAEVYGDQSRV